MMRQPLVRLTNREGKYFYLNIATTEITEIRPVDKPDASARVLFIEPDCRAVAWTYVQESPGEVMAAIRAAYEEAEGKEAK
jgi:hypothetical protein